VEPFDGSLPEPVLPVGEKQRGGCRGTVEVHQTAEEPVVNKTARVAEEVVVRKDVTERTETVRDDVRREEVDVQNADRRPA
jgi:stress response protein YsnF